MTGCSTEECPAETGEVLPDIRSQGEYEMTENPAQKDPAEWTTGDEPMTAAQESYLTTLAHESGETVPDNLTKAQASELIDKLRGRSDRLKGS
jgi:prophage antirepressor-like protein